MVDRLGGTSPGVSTQAVLLKLLNISAVACVAQALGETPTDGGQRHLGAHLGALRKQRLERSAPPKSLT